MLCRKPFVRGMTAFGCGQCIPCRITRRRIWTHRIMLESMVHESSCFATLTYDEAFLPSGGTLVPRDLQLFLKRLRKRLGWRQLRFFGVGEYGDVSFRPHYHLALFGLSAEGASGSVGETIANWKKYKASRKRCWQVGHVDIRPLVLENAAYLCGYVVKKMTKADDARLCGRYPEFARMSLKPGVGALSVQDIATALQSHAGWDEIARLGDVPSVLQHGSRRMPLGRYMRSRLRAAMNFEEIGGSDEAVFRHSAELLNMYRDYLISSSVEGRVALGLSSAIVAAGAQKAANVTARYKINNSRRKL